MLLSDARAALPVGDGLLCLGIPWLRFVQDVLQSGANGQMAFQPDLAHLPEGTVVHPGETWRFQLWPRDGGGSNLSSSLALTWR